MYILQGDLGFIFNTLKKTRPPPPPFFQKTALLLPNNPALSRNNPALFLLKAGLLGKEITGNAMTSAATGYRHCAISTPTDQSPLIYAITILDRLQPQRRERI